MRVVLASCMGGSGKYVAFVGLTTAAGPPRRRGYILFKTFDEKWEEPGHGDYYGVIDLNLARAPQSLLAYDMKGHPLPVDFGAPLRLRLETQLGYKMVKWIRSMEPDRRL